MHPLLLLYKLQAKALFRRLTRNLTSPKGIILFVLGMIVLAMWIGPSAWQALKMPRADPAEVLNAGPAIMLMFCMISLLSSGGERAIVFTPAEIDFLFPGPFTRRQLLAYKIGKSLAGILFTSLLMSVFLLRFAAAWQFAWIASFLAFFFIHLLSIAIALIAQSAGERAYTRSRKIILALIILIIASAILPELKSGGRTGFYELAKSLHASKIGAILLAPLEVFSRIFVSTSWWPDGLMYAAIAIGMNALLIFFVFFFDADYLEAVAAKSQAVHARLQRMRKGGIAAMGSSAKKGRWSIPHLPFWAGAGPIAARQATAALRNSRGLVVLIAFIIICIAPLMFAADTPRGFFTSLAGALLWMILLVPTWLRFDFRGDLELFDNLKSFPISSFALSIGQLIIPTLMLTLCQWIILASAAALQIYSGSFNTRMPGGQNSLTFLLYAAIFALPFNAILFATENVLFLIFPSRAASTPGDIQGYGRQILMFMAKGTVLALATAIAAMFGFIAHLLGTPTPAAIFISATMLAGIAIATLPVVAWAFSRFDVASEIPA